MEEVMKKLALWHTRTFRPIMTHDDLDPIMTSLGFISLPLPSPLTPSPWKEYAFNAAAANTNSKAFPDSDHLPRPRLPFPRIDGLHLQTYRAFIDAVGFYIGGLRVADHFHVRGMPLHRVHDRVFDKVFRRMSDERRMSEDEGIFVFREGTLDHTASSFSNNNTSISPNDLVSSSSSSSTSSSICLVPLKDIIPVNDITV